MSGIYIAGGSIAVGGAAQAYGSNQAAKAAADAAQAQLAYAGQVRAGTINLASATPQELSQIGQQYQASMQNLQQQQQLMASIDPALMAASKQALTLLQGGTAAVNNPMMAQRSSQRQQLVQSLQNQYGPGAESSSVGQQALQQFDQQTNTMFQQNQQGSLSQMMGIANSGGNEGGLSAALGGVNQAYGNYANITQRQIAASNGTAGPVINAAGANSVAAGLQGQGIASIGGNIMQGGLGFAGAYAGRNNVTVNSGIGAGLNPSQQSTVNSATSGSYADPNNMFSGDSGMSSTWGPADATGYGPVTIPNGSSGGLGGNYGFAGGGANVSTFSE